MHNFDKKISRRLSEAGFTMLELTVASFLGLIVSSLALTTLVSTKKTLNYDMVRTRIDQNIRSGMDVISSDVRVGGENLTSSFPAFEIVDGTSGAPDQLVIRRNLLDEVLSVCQNITSGTPTSQVMFAVPAAATASCTYSGQGHNFNAWKTYRTSNGGQVKAYIYNVSTKLGEFFTYANETDGGTSYSITRTGGSWVNSYPVGSSSIYILEEWRFKMNADILAIEQNADTTTPKNVISGLKDFQVTAYLEDGSSKTTFARTDVWSSIIALELSLKAEESYQKQLVTRSLTSRYFPRNILSQ